MRKTSFASGKLILVGEHAVVYGRMALAASIGLGVRVEVEKTLIEEKYNEIITRAIEVAGGDKFLKLTIESGLPIGSGLGSSAAVAAAAIRAIRRYLGKPVENEELFKLTMECEKIAHGNPSGIDPATVVYGGLITFKKGKPIEKLELAKPLNLLLVDTGKPEESTKEMVEFVAKQPGKELFIEKIGELANKVKERLIAGDVIDDLINENGTLLEELGVVGKWAKKISSGLRKMGYSVKVTGAGGRKTGSGMMIVMGKDFAQARELLDNTHIRYFETMVGKV